MNKSLLWKTSIFTSLALVAFAANSILCRWALKEESIDAGTFTGIRLLSGAIILLLIVKIRTRNQKKRSSGSWISGAMLFLYAIAFSLSYVTLDTATGALILFGAVQLTMILYAIFKGKKLQWMEWIGFFLAVGGFVYLLLPGATAPSLKGFILMTISGMAWGIYTLRGKHSKNPLEDTGYNFLRSLPFLLLPMIWLADQTFLTARGIQLAILSGAVTSGLGYTIWYMALRGLSTVQASVVQLSVPLIAAIGGILLLSEILTTRLLISAFMILGGILLVILTRSPGNSSN